MSKLTDTQRGRFLVVILSGYVVFMILATIPVLFSMSYGWVGYLVVTGIFLWILVCMYFIPRISNWIEHRRWDARP